MNRLGIALGLGLGLESATLWAISSERSHDLCLNIGGLITEIKIEFSLVQLDLEALTKGH